MPRKVRRTDTNGDRGTGFNEAGAVMPRKVSDATTALMSLDGFNEAGAVMPRKASRLIAPSHSSAMLQ